MKLNGTQVNAVTDEIIAKLKEKRQRQTEEFFESSEGQNMLDTIRHNLDEYKRQMDIHRNANIAANRCKEQIVKHLSCNHRYLEDMSIEDVRSEIIENKSTVKYFEKDDIKRQVTIAGIKGVEIDNFINDMVNKF